MKRITNISVENYKAYIQKEDVKLPKGENLLIYGENGSGKTSLYKALYHFLESSANGTHLFERNCFSGIEDGRIEITYSDYDSTSKTIIGGHVSYLAHSDVTQSTNQTPDVRLINRLSGFLDYSTLLKVYLIDKATPNLFELLMVLLGRHIPTKYAWTETLGECYDRICTEIVTCVHRTDYKFLYRKADFDKLRDVMPNVINDLNAIFSDFIRIYFGSMNMNVKLKFISIDLKDNNRIQDIRIKGSCQLEVIHNGNKLPDYNFRLNEARLSAIAICLYLATMKLRYDRDQTKLLYLDDVFIGLDSANRRPIIEILKKEFSDYQLFISTYDKSWYNLVREYIGDLTEWKCIELYEGEFITVDGMKVARPKIVKGASLIEMARRYLYKEGDLDYPAAANYMRKAYEELLTKNVYRPAVLDSNLEPVPSFKIPGLIKSIKTFLASMPHDSHALDLIKLLDKLLTYVRPMLHPLSHYAPNEPFYKGELIGGDNLYDEISDLLKVAKYYQCKPLATKGGHIKFVIKGAGWEQVYDLVADGHLFSYIDGAGVKHVSECPLHVHKIEEKDGAGNVTAKKLITKSTKNYSNYCYTNIDNCKDKIVSYLDTCGAPYDTRVVLARVTDMFYVPSVEKRPMPGVVFKKSMTKML